VGGRGAHPDGGRLVGRPPRRPRLGDPQFLQVAKDQLFVGDVLAPGPVQLLAELLFVPDLLAGGVVPALADHAEAEAHAVHGLRGDRVPHRLDQPVVVQPPDHMGAALRRQLRVGLFGDALQRRDGDGPDQRVPAVVELDLGRVLPEGLLHRPRRDLLPEAALPGVDDRLPVEHRGEPVQCQTVSGFPAVGRGPERERRLTEHVLAGRDFGALLSAPFCRLAHVPAPPAGAWPDSPFPSSGSLPLPSSPVFWSPDMGGWSWTLISGLPCSSVWGSSRVQSRLITASTALAWVNPSLTRATIVDASWDCTAAWSW